MTIKIFNMKCIRILLFIIICLLPASSCDDWLELIPPDGLVRDEYWKSKEDIEATLMGAYQSFAGLNGNLFLFGEMRADMIESDQNTPNAQRSIMLGNIYPSNSMTDWSEFYKVINYCNNVLKYAPEIIKFDQTFTEYQMRGFEAEAVFLRSLAYFYLVRIFKEVPLVLEPSEQDDVQFYLPKSADTTILRVISEDLNKVKLYVTDDYGSDEENLGRATKGAILSLLADISLWNFDYQECIDYIYEIEEIGYLLMPGGKWFEVFYPGNSLEGIFEFQFDDGLGQNNALWQKTYYTNRVFQASKTALDLLTPETSSEIIRGPGSLRSYDGMIWKFCGAASDGVTYRPSSERNSCNWVVYRYADVLLMKAEALSQLERFDEALTIINQIRSRALMNAAEIPYTTEAFEDAIMEERATELAFEGKRWFDLLRLGRRNNYSRKSKLIEIIIEKVPSTQKLVLASKLTDPFGWYLPIQENELERNSNLVQNPYYADYSTD